MTNVDDALQAALAPLGLPVYPTVYVGTDLEYLVTTHTALPAVFAERAPQAARHLVTVRYFLPFGKNPNHMLQLIARALWEEGFTWPSMTDAADGEGQVWALECEYANAGAYYGQT